jgi:hypothetical protein
LQAELYSSDRSCDALSYLVDRSPFARLNMQHFETQKLVTVFVVPVVVVFVFLVVVVVPPHVLLQFLAFCCQHCSRLF